VRSRRIRHASGTGRDPSSPSEGPAATLPACQASASRPARAGREVARGAGTSRRGPRGSAGGSYSRAPGIDRGRGRASYPTPRNLVPCQRRGDPQFHALARSAPFAHLLNQPPRHHRALSSDRRSGRDGDRTPPRERCGHGSLWGWRRQGRLHNATHDAVGTPHRRPHLCRQTLARSPSAFSETSHHPGSGSSPFTAERCRHAPRSCHHPPAPHRPGRRSRRSRGRAPSSPVRREPTSTAPRSAPGGWRPGARRG
jgi:hypothetical protein